MINFRQSIFFIVIFFITYLIYVYPLDVLNYFIFKDSIFKLSSLLFTVIFYLILIFYFKDLSLALGKIDRIPINLGIWSPVIALSFFTFIGVLQINEK